MTSFTVFDLNLPSRLFLVYLEYGDHGRKQVVVLWLWGVHELFDKRQSLESIIKNGFKNIIKTL